MTSPISRRVSRTLFALVAVGTLVATLDVSCNIYDSSLLVAEAGPAFGGGIGWWSGNSDQGGLCFSAGVPTNASRPSPQSAPDLDPIYLAIHDVQLGALDKTGASNPNAWKDIGFDLDGLCTGSPTCDTGDTPPQVACQSTANSIVYDGNYCRDNTFGRLEFTVSLVPEVAQKYGLNDDAFNCALCVGDYNYLIRLSGYNGTDNDDQVRADIYPSPGLETILPWNCSDNSWRSEPCFTPDAPWTVWDQFLTDVHDGPALSNSTLFDDQAFVKEGYLVAHLPDGTRFWFPGKNALATAYPVYLQGGVVTAKLGRAQDQTWIATDGIVAGRSKGTDLIEGFRQIGFCENDPNYSLLQTFVTPNLDLLADGTINANTACDSMSIGFAFTATQATAGKVAQAADLTDCPFGDTPPDGGVDEGGVEGGASDSGASDAGPKDAGPG